METRHTVVSAGSSVPTKPVGPATTAGAAWAPAAASGAIAAGAAARAEPIWSANDPTNGIVERVITQS